MEIFATIAAVIIMAGGVSFGTHVGSNLIENKIKNRAHGAGRVITVSMGSNAKADPERSRKTA